LIATLPEKERLIVEDYYLKEKSFVEIANENGGMSKSWVSRLHSRALELLKERLLEE
jgi:RNA polymerase sigma factor (sigma-70 family)